MVNYIKFIITSNIIIIAINTISINYFMAMIFIHFPEMDKHFLLLSFNFNLILLLLFIFLLKVKKAFILYRFHQIINNILIFIS